MSIWRDIWKESLSANRIMGKDEKGGLDAFHNLIGKFGEDGMIHYAKAAAWEYRDNIPLALEEYKQAQKLFPVTHWKDVARKSITRLERGQSLETFFNMNNFYDLLDYTFQKVYEYVYLDDLVRYICLSAISRASSEWPLSLIDFRTILELQIKQVFPELIYDEDMTLIDLINTLYRRRIIDNGISAAMHQIRKAGNNATHSMKTNDEDDIKNIKQFLLILKFFNTYNLHPQRRKS